MKLDNRIASFASVGQPAMIAEATWNARKGADKFAEDPHSKRGRIKTVCVVSDIEYYLKD